MKKFITVLLITLLSLSNILPGFAEGMTFYESGNKYLAKQIVNRIVVDGKVYPVNNAQITKGQVLVPVSFLKNTLGAEIGTNKLLKTTTISYNGIKMDVKANVNAGWVNGKPAVFLAAPKLVGKELLIPLKNLVNAAGQEFFYSKYSKNAYVETVIKDYTPLFKEYIEKYGNSFTADGYMHYEGDELFLGEYSTNDINYNSKPITQAVMRLAMAWKSDYGTIGIDSSNGTGVGLAYFNSNYAEFVTSGLDPIKKIKNNYVGEAYIQRMIDINETAVDKMDYGWQSPVGPYYERFYISYCKEVFGKDWAKVFDVIMKSRFTPPLKGSKYGNMKESTHYAGTYKIVITHDGTDMHYYSFYKK